MLSCDFPDSIPIRRSKLRIFGDGCLRVHGPFSIDGARTGEHKSLEWCFQFGGHRKQVHRAGHVDVDAFFRMSIAIGALQSTQVNDVGGAKVDQRLDDL